MANLRQALRKAFTKHALTPTLQVSAVEKNQFPDGYGGGISGWTVRYSDRARQP